MAHRHGQDGTGEVLLTAGTMAGALLFAILCLWLR